MPSTPYARIPSARHQPTVSADPPDQRIDCAIIAHCSGRGPDLLSTLFNAPRSANHASCRYATCNVSQANGTTDSGETGELLRKRATPWKAFSRSARNEISRASCDRADVRHSAAHPQHSRRHQTAKPDEKSFALPQTNFMSARNVEVMSRLELADEQPFAEFPGQNTTRLAPFGRVQCGRPG